MDELHIMLPRHQYITTNISRPGECSFADNLCRKSFRDVVHVTAGHLKRTHALVRVMKPEFFAEFCVETSGNLELVEHRHKGLRDEACRWGGDFCLRPYGDKLHIELDVVQSIVRPLPVGPLVVATDASVRRGTCGLGFLASNGTYGYRRIKLKSVSLGEIYAIDFAISSLEPGSVRVIFSDSIGALRQCRDWRSGRIAHPQYSQIKKQQWESIEEMRRRLSEALYGVQLSHVKGHNGDLLNEAADSLANIARLYGEPEASQRAKRLVEGFMMSYRG